MASLSKDDGPSNWNLCVEHGLMGTRSAVAGSIRAGDDLFIWLAESGFIAWTRALEDSRRVTPGMGLPWPDPDGYKYVWRMEVLDDRVDDPVDRSWNEVKNETGITASPQFFPKVPADSVGALTEHFVDFAREVGAVERATLMALPTEDQRKYRLATRAVREGQREFRRDLERAYDNRCAISGTSDRAALEAAHIAPYLGVASNQTPNGLLLRSDLHALYDAHLLSVSPDGVVHVAATVVSAEYQALDGRRMDMPAKATDHPATEQLAQHHRRFLSRTP
ncbi:HNH endonuclease [Pseudokineococcus sp. 5B2Z-1]|uniref:HNH endonuclease n=1 Tax=Pseudokineococcus sp. 5B2Z-1 TaxID=3132744 RepID=UPI0030B49711